MVNKIKSAGFIYLPGSTFCEAEGHLTMRSWLQDAVNNSSPRIVKYINILEFYRQLPPRRVKESKMFEVENTSCVRSVVKVPPVSVIEREAWDAAGIIIKLNDGVYISTCSFIYDEYNCKTKHAFVYDSHLDLCIN